MCFPPFMPVPLLHPPLPAKGWLLPRGSWSLLASSGWSQDIPSGLGLSPRLVGEESAVEMMEHNKPSCGYYECFKRAKLRPLLLFENRRCHTDDSAAKPARMLMVSCWEAKPSDGWQCFSRRKCSLVLWRHMSSRKRSVIFSVSILFFPYKQQMIICF